MINVWRQLQPLVNEIASALKIMASKQTNATQVILPPNYKVEASLVGMNCLDKAEFNQTVSYACVEVPFSKCNEVSKSLKAFLVKLPNFKAVRNSDEGKGKLFVLNPDAVSELHSKSITFSCFTLDAYKIYLNFFVSP